MKRRRSCFQVSAGFHKRSDQHVSVAVTQREAKGGEGGSRYGFKPSELVTWTLLSCRSAGIQLQPGDNWD